MQTRQPLPPKMRQRPHVRTLFRQAMLPRPRLGELPLRYHVQLPHPPRRHRARNPRARRPRPPIPMPAMTCPRWPITTWKACNPAHGPSVRIVRRNRLQAIVTKIRTSEKDGPASPRSPAGRRCPWGRSGTPREDHPNARGSVSSSSLSSCQALPGMASCYTSIALPIAWWDMERNCQ